MPNVAAIHISKSHGTSIGANPGNPVLRHVYPCESVSIRGQFFLADKGTGHGWTRIQNCFENYPCRD